MELNYQYQCTMSILIENQASILTRVIGLLTRRGFIIESLVIGSTEYNSISRLIIILPGNLRLIDQVTRQLYKLFPVVKVHNLTHVPSIKRELSLFKLFADNFERQRVLEIAKIFSANVIDCTNKTLTLEVTGDSEKTVAIEQMLHKFGILEKVQTGKIALTCESIMSGQLYTSKKESLRRKMINSHIREIEAKLYI